MGRVHNIGIEIKALGTEGQEEALRPSEDILEQAALLLAHQSRHSDTQNFTEND